MTLNPIEVAFKEITGMKPDDFRLTEIAVILLIADIFNQEKYRALLLRCLQEIAADPDSYSEEVRNRASYQLGLLQLEKLDHSPA